MRLHIAPAVTLALAALPFSLPAGEVKPSREQVMAHLDSMRASQRGMMNIAPSEGEYLGGLVRKLKAKRVLEIGTSNGYSGIWLAWALAETGGRLITLEIDGDRHSLALRNFKAVGLDVVIDARLANALEEIPKIEGPFDLVFIDAWKPDYVKYLQMVLPKVRSGGVIAAHNVRDGSGQMRDFLEAIRTSPLLTTEFVNAGPGGFSISYKK